MEWVTLVWAFLAGALVGAVGLSQWDFQRSLKAKSVKRKASAAKAATTRKKKAVEAVKEPSPTLDAGTDASLYGRRGNGETSWAE